MVTLMRRPSISTLLYWPMADSSSFVLNDDLPQVGPIRNDAFSPATRERPHKEAGIGPNIRKTRPSEFPEETIPPRGLGIADIVARKCPGWAGQDVGRDA